MSRKGVGVAHRGRQKVILHSSLYTPLAVAPTWALVVVNKSVVRLLSGWGRGPSLLAKEGGEVEV